MRIITSLIGIICTATVITLALGYGYLRGTNQITDEKVFRMVALLQDVDLEAVAKKQNALLSEEVPPEEPSVGQLEQYRHIKLRNYEAKSNSLSRGIKEYDHRLEKLSERTERYDQLAKDWKNRLETHRKISAEAGVLKVVRDLESLRPATAKRELMRFITEDPKNGMLDVILLMNSMTRNKLVKVLREFETDDELDRLKQIHQLILDGHPDKPLLDEAMKQLDDIQE